MLFAIVVGIPLGILAALRANTWPRLQRDGGREPRLRGAELPRRDAAHLLLRGQVGRHLRRADERLGHAGSRKVLPAIALGLGPMTYFARLVRGSMLETLQQDYVRTAKAKGLRWRRVVVVHVLRNSLIPAVTAAGAAARLPHHRLVHHREHLRDPGDRPVLRDRRHRARLLGGDGPHGAARDDRHRREHGRRHPLRRSSTRGRERRGRDGRRRRRSTASASRRSPAEERGTRAPPTACSGRRGADPRSRASGATPGTASSRNRAAVIAGGRLPGARRLRA